MVNEPQILFVFISNMAGYASTELGPANPSADVNINYKDFEEFGYSPASSFAQPIITTVCEQLVEKGIDSHSAIVGELKTMVLDGNGQRILNMDRVTGK